MVNDWKSLLLFHVTKMAPTGPQDLEKLDYA